MLIQDLVVIAKRKKRKKKEVRSMKTKLLLLAVAVLGTPILAHAVPPPTAPDGLCTHASGTAITVINILLALLGKGPIC